MNHLNSPIFPSRKAQAARHPQHGTASAPLVELPPNPVSVYGSDPSTYPRRSLDGVTHEADWLQPNGLIDQCARSETGRPAVPFERVQRAVNGHSGR
jgi:hypothetical protein